MFFAFLKMEKGSFPLIFFLIIQFHQIFKSFIGFFIEVFLAQSISINWSHLPCFFVQFGTVYKIFIWSFSLDLLCLLNHFFTLHKSHVQFLYLFFIRFKNKVGLDLVFSYSHPNFPYCFLMIGFEHFNNIFDFLVDDSGGFESFLRFQECVLGDHFEVVDAIP